MIDGFRGVTVDLASNVTINVDGNSVVGIFTANPGYTYTVNSATVRAINIDVKDAEIGDIGDENYYTASLKSVDPTNVIDNSVQVVGNFRSDDESSGALRFVTITGTAKLNTGTLTTTVGTPDFERSYLSAFQLEGDFTETITTTLDENGLVTPTISVTNGINLNGSRISNLGAGTEVADAVTLGQLNDAVATILTGVEESSVQLGGGSTLAQDAVAIGNVAMAGGGASVSIGLGNEAMGNGAVAIGDPNIATGQGAVAIGADNTAKGQGAVAVGNLSVANGESAIALGDAANANAANAIAVCGGASAGFAESTAVGAAAATKRANQVTLGATGTSVTVGDIAASTAAQAGPTDIVTVDANGTIGRETPLRTAIAAAQTSASAISAIQALDTAQMAA